MKNPRITEEEIGIIKDAQAGDMSAFNKLFYKYKSFVDHILFTYLKDMDEAKDITNIVFLKVYDKLSTFTEYNSFGGWLRTITNHVAIDYLRKIKNADIPMDAATVRLTEANSISSCENDLVNRITYENITQLFKNLSPTARKACELYYINNMKVDEISRILSIPKNTVKSHLSRTRKKLKKQIKNI